MPPLLAAINWHSVFFLLYALVACGMGLAVLFSSNIVRMAFYLTISLGAVSGLFILAGAHFVGAMQLMIYVGGTLVLLIFGVMLTAQAQFIEMRTRGGEWVLAAIVGGSLLTVLLFTAMAVPAWSRPSDDYLASIKNIEVEGDTTTLGAGLMGLRPDKLSQQSEQLKRGMSGYFFQFEIVSMHLLVVLIGAAYLARARHRVERLVVRPGTLPAPRRRNAFVTGVIILAIAAHVACAAMCFAGAETFKGRIPGVADAEPWLWSALGVCCIVDALLLMVILGWQKWGFFAACVMAAVEAGLIYGAGVNPVFALAALGIGAVWLAVLYGLLQIGGPRSMWAQME
jgi:NADH:ubiquinone oxidoreductase subunit 6 (subunit J)